jgi:hypothetical protein
LYLFASHILCDDKYYSFEICKEYTFVDGEDMVKSHDSSVSVVLGYGLDDWGSRVLFLVGAGNFSLHYHVQDGSGAHPASIPVVMRGSFAWVKWPGHEADHSLPSSAEVKECMDLYLHTPVHHHGMVFS